MRVKLTLKRVPCARLAAVAVFSNFSFATARPWRPSEIPNGTVFHCARCHAPEGPRNSFGLAVQAVVAPGSRDPLWGPAEWNDVLTTDASGAVVPRDAESAFLGVQSKSNEAGILYSVWIHGTAEAARI